MWTRHLRRVYIFFFNDTATTEIYTLSLHDALPILAIAAPTLLDPGVRRRGTDGAVPRRSEEHTSELQSRLHLVCRLLLEKKKNHSALHTPCCPASHSTISNRCNRYAGRHADCLR